MSSRTPRPKSVGFVATGPGFYIWEETRSAALSAARDLSPRSAAEPEVVAVAERARQRRKSSDEEPDDEG